MGVYDNIIFSTLKDVLGELKAIKDALSHCSLNSLHESEHETQSTWIVYGFLDAYGPFDTFEEAKKWVMTYRDCNKWTIRKLNKVQVRCK